jgi:TonB family protein
MSLANNAQRTAGREAAATGRSRAGRGATDGLVVLTRDAALLQTVQRVAVGHGHDCSIIHSEPDLASQLTADHAGVAIIDAAAVSTPIAALTQKLAAQFPGLVLIVAGDARDQAALAAHVTTGTVHRFLHRPVSDERVRTFVDSAWRRHDHEPPMLRRAAAASITGSHTQLAPPSSRNDTRIRVAAIAVGVLVVAGVGVWLFTSGDEPATPAAAPQAPASDDTYRQAASPVPATASVAEFDRLLADAERALATENVDEAERLAAAAGALEPDHPRVAFVVAQIGQERERILLTRAREAAATGDVEAAIAVLEAGGTRDSTLVDETRRELEQQRVDSRVADFLQRSRERRTAGALIDPPQNNARFFVESALALAPQDAGVLEARRQLADQMIAAARTSIEGGQLDGAERMLAAAGDSGASRATLAPVRRSLEAARTAARGEAVSSLFERFQQRLENGQVVEPANDSAKHWLARLVATDPQHASTREARRAFAERALASGRESARRGDLAAGDNWIMEARAAGAPAEGMAALERELSAARAEAARRNSVVSASSLTRVRYVEPKYPRQALERGTEGWVDLEFTVGTDGTVGNVTVVRAEPAGVFDAAASASLSRWRFRPVMVDGRPVDQRARVRLQFDVAED